MSERNSKMAAMLAGDAPAAHDLAFEIAVLAKIEQRRFIRGIARNLAMAMLAALLLALVMPMLSLPPGLIGWAGGLSRLTDNNLVMLALLTAAFAAWRLRPGAEA